MDHMRLEGELAKRIVKKLLKRSMKKKFDVEKEICIDDFFVDYTDGKFTIQLKASADLDQTSAWKIISGFMSKGRA